jgi:hypothetical protein
MPDEIALSSALLLFTSLPLVAGLMGVLALRAQSAERLGATLHHAPDGRTARRRSPARVGLALLAVVAVVTPGVSTLFALWVLAGAAALLLLSPSASDTVVGSRGVRAGFLAYPMERLDEWRLTGEHLRWRIGERWYACALPMEHHEETRAYLQALAPERESRFAH